MNKNRDFLGLFEQVDIMNPREIKTRDLIGRFVHRCAIYKSKEEMIGGWCIETSMRLIIFTIFVNLGLFRHFVTITKYKNMDRFTHILENVARCKYFEAVFISITQLRTHIKMCLRRTTQILDHVVVVHILI